MLIQYEADGQRWRGSGLRIGGNRILTADHCARGQHHTISVEGNQYPAEVLARTETRDVDVAILAADKLSSLTPMRLALVSRDHSWMLTDCQALGFPRWKDSGEPRRRPLLAAAPGFIPVAEGIDPRASRDAPAMLTLKVTGPEIGSWPLPQGPIDHPSSQWAGMSGAVVVTAADEIIGVVRSHNLTEGAGSLTVVPLQAIDSLQPRVAEQLWRHLGVTDAGSLRCLSNTGGGIVVGRIPDRPGTFVERGTVEHLARTIERGDVAVVCAVTGMRGVGKTHIAAAYARSKLTAGFDLVGWVDAESQASLIDGLAEIAKRLNVADPRGDSLRSAERLRDHLATWTGTGLIVFDNAVDPDAVAAFLPRSGNTRIIITSADLAMNRLGAPVEVDYYTREESIDYLDRTTGRGKGDLADAIADELGDLPLALAQGAATIRDQNLTYERYLQRLKQLPVADLLGRLPGDDYPRSTAAALLMAVAAVDGEYGPPASSIIRILATLSPSGVQRDILYTVMGAPSNVKHEVAVDGVLQHCTQAAIVMWSIADDAVFMHRLVARLIRESEIAKGAYTEAIAGALHTLHPHLFGYWETTWAKRELGSHLIAQIDAVWEASAGVVDDQPLLGELFDARRWAVRHLHAMADLSQEVASAQRLVDDSREILGPTDRRTLRARRDLADALRASGRLDDSIRLYEEALHDSESALETDDPETLECRNDLGYALRFAGRLDEALECLTRAVEDRTRVLGGDHPDTMTSCNALAATYRKAGQIKTAIALFETNLGNRRLRLGDKHPQTMFSRGNLAMAYRADGRYEEARRLGEELLRDREEVLGADHPETHGSRNDLAFTYKSLRLMDQAIELFEETYRARVRLLGNEHPRTMLSQSNLGRAYRDAGRHDDAICLLKDTVQARERIFGDTHPQTLLSRFNLGLAYQSAGKADIGLPMLERSLHDRVTLLGPRHPDTLTSRHYLALTYMQNGQQEKAGELLEENLELREQVLGPEDLKTQSSRYQLARYYAGQGRHNDAERLLKAALSVRLSALGENHPDTLRTRRRLHEVATDRTGSWDESLETEVRDGW